MPHTFWAFVEPESILCSPFNTFPSNLHAIIHKVVILGAVVFLKVSTLLSSHMEDTGYDLQLIKKLEIIIFCS